MELTDDDRAIMRHVSRYLEHANLAAQQSLQSRPSPIGQLLSEHLGTDAQQLPVVVHSFPGHRLVDADVALEQLSSSVDSRMVGISGGEQKLHHGLSELIANPYMPFGTGPVDYSSLATGPAGTRQVVSYGVRLLHHDGEPIALLQRSASPQHGRPAAQVEVVAGSANTVDSFLAALRTLMVERSVLRGQVLSFNASEYGQAAGATFLPRPSIPAEEVVLAEGILDAMTRHVVGIGQQREHLLAANQHLKRGVLLYGPPGTGKTHSVRHLLSITPNVTAIVLTGSSIALITEAAELARVMQPAIVVLEDVDLIAMERGSSPQPLLFEVLDALDGLDGDADVAFIMTTNRVHVLERALAERPGRVDLAVEIPLPELDERRRLLSLYAGDLPVSADAVDRTAQRSEGTTGSFAKELVRRAVLRAALDGARTASDEHLDKALDELLSSREALTRRLLGETAANEDLTKPDVQGPQD